MIFARHFSRSLNSAFCLTPGNIDDRKPVPKLFKKLQGLAAGDKSYISKTMAK
ncbi:MAG: hypothetical protein GY742_18465 [Hyphomicrobiales bacterium]|nr:hypothetical protein [Hyphomicrobiales bacterium]